MWLETTATRVCRDQTAERVRNPESGRRWGGNPARNDRYISFRRKAPNLGKVSSIPAVRRRTPTFGWSRSSPPGGWVCRSTTRCGHDWFARYVRRLAALSGATDSERPVPVDCGDAGDRDGAGSLAIPRAATDRFAVRCESTACDGRTGGDELGDCVSRASIGVTSEGESRDATTGSLRKAGSEARRG